MGFLTGGSKQRSNSTSTSSSSNQAYPFLQQTLGGLVSNAGTGTNAINALLGLGGDPADQLAAFDRFKDSSGYQFAFDEGQRAVTGSQAARGLLNSGSTLKALTTFGQNIGNQYFNNYLDRLLQSANQGFNAAQIIGAAGNISNSSSNSVSTGKSSNGLGGLIGSIGSAFASSDRRLKKNIERVGTLSNGLPVYSFVYKDTGVKTFGVMADEVRDLFPEALGPQVDGFDTVNYAKLVRKAA